MGFMDFLKGIKRPDPGVEPVSREALSKKLMGMNHEEIPFKVSPSDKTDILIELKIVDAQWYEIFAKANLTKTYKVYLLLDDSTNEVRALERIGEVKWKAGVPSLSFSKSGFQGRTIAQKEFGKAYAFKAPNPTSFGKVYEYSFDVGDIKDPLIELVTKSGWSYVPVTTMRKVKRR